MNSLPLVLDRTELIDELQKAGAVFRGKSSYRCWLHEDKRASGSVFWRTRGGTTGWAFKCHSCNVRGNVYDLNGGVRKADMPIFPGENTPEKQEENFCLSGMRKHEHKTEGHLIVNALIPEGGDRCVSYCSIEDLIRDKIHGDEFCDGVYVYEKFTVVRIEAKDGSKRFFTSHKKSDERVYLGAGSPGPHPLYLRGSAQEIVFIVEGEKKVDVLAGHGFQACTSAFGSGAFKGSDWGILKNRRVVVWPDLDVAGMKYAAGVCGMLVDAGAKEVRVVNELDLRQYLGDKGDVIDLIQSLGDDATEVIAKLIEGAKIMEVSQELRNSCRSNNVSSSDDQRERSIPMTGSSVSMNEGAKSFVFPWGKINSLLNDLMGL
jgi:hypothetical protein